MVFPIKRLADLGFRVLATDGTAEMLRRNGIPCETARKISDAGPEDEPTIVDQIRDGEIDIVFNTPYGNSGPRVDGYEIRSAAVLMNIPCITTVQGAAAAVQGIEAAIRGDIGVRSLQDQHEAMRTGRSAGAHWSLRRLRSGAPMTPFGSRLRAAVAERGPVCVGIDPHPELLRAWGLSDDAAGLEQFAEICVEAFDGVDGAGEAAGRVLRKLRIRGYRGPRADHLGAARIRDAGARRRQTRRHRFHDGGVRADVAR